jgi:hypothetical protein
VENFAELREKKLQKIGVCSWQNKFAELNSLLLSPFGSVVQKFGGDASEMTIRSLIGVALFCVSMAHCLLGAAAIWKMIEEVDRSMTHVSGALATVSELSKSVQFHP